MKKSSLVALLMVLSLPLMASAQEGAPKVEIFGGYSYVRTDTNASVSETISARGFNTSIAGNITKHIGIVGEFSRFTASDGFTISGAGRINIDSNVVTYLFGPRITLHRGRVEPFVHALLGGARENDKFSGGIVNEVTENAFAFALGGGLDVKAHNNFAIRIAQVDYLGDRIGAENGKNFRYSVGVVIRLGSR